MALDRVDMEEKKAAAFRLADEMEELAQELLDKANELKEEIHRGREQL